MYLFNCVFLCSVTDRKYCVIQCTGYLKSWAPAKIGLEESEGEGDGEACNLSCLVAVGRVQPQIAAPISNFTRNGCCRQPSIRSLQFISRHAMDGKFLFVDQRLVSEMTGLHVFVYFYLLPFHLFISVLILLILIHHILL
jgi:aryl hydrocarbon receptor nuclear translocator-like protein 1